jgi:hypothetical protein
MRHQFDRIQASDLRMQIASLQRILEREKADLARSRKIIADQRRQITALKGELAALKAITFSRCAE